MRGPHIYMRVSMCLRLQSYIDRIILHLKVNSFPAMEGMCLNIRTFESPDSCLKTSYLRSDLPLRMPVQTLETVDWRDAHA